MVNSVPATRSNAWGQVMQFLQSDKVTTDHISSLISIGQRIVEARIKQGLEDVQTTNRIRLLIANFRVDSARCEKAVETFRELAEFMSDEEKSEMAAAIIKIQLGVRPENL